MQRKRCGPSGHNFSVCVFQVALTGSQIWWAMDVGIAFERVEEGFETALKDYNKKQVIVSFTHSLAWTLAYAVIHWPTHSSCYSFTQSLIYLHVLSLTQSCSNSVTKVCIYVCMHASIADPPAELSDKHAARRAEPWWSPEDHDTLYHWCSCSWCGGQAYLSEGNHDDSAPLHPVFCDFPSKSKVSVE